MADLKLFCVACRLSDVALNPNVALAPCRGPCDRCGQMLGYSSVTRDRIIDGCVLLCWQCHEAEIRDNPVNIAVEVFGLGGHEEMEQILAKNRRAN